MRSYRFLIILISILATAMSASAGEVKFVTYLTDPQEASIYDRLHLPLRMAMPDVCAPGILYVKKDDGKLYLCDKNNQWINLGSVWTDTDNSEIFPLDSWTDPALRVGIGLADPTHALEVRDPAFTSNVMFIEADKGALRAGNDSSGWDADKIGEFSTAFGDQTQASGKNSFAAGYKSAASGESSFAYGENAKASGELSVALGDRAKAEGKKSVVFAVGNEDKATLERENTAAFLGGNVALGRTEVSSPGSFGRSLQVYDDAAATMSLATKTKDYGLAALSQSASLAGHDLEAGFHIVNKTNSNVLMSYDSSNGYMSFGKNAPDNTFDVNGDMRVDGLAGEGNAYACVDQDGEILRSADRCSQRVHIICPDYLPDKNHASIVVPDDCRPFGQSWTGTQWAESPYYASNDQFLVDQGAVAGAHTEVTSEYVIEWVHWLPLESLNNTFSWAVPWPYNVFGDPNSGVRPEYDANQAAYSYSSRILSSYVDLSQCFTDTTPYGGGGDYEGTFAVPWDEYFSFPDSCGGGVEIHCTQNPGYLKRCVFDRSDIETDCPCFLMCVTWMPGRACVQECPFCACDVDTPGCVNNGLIFGYQNGVL